MLVLTRKENEQITLETSDGLIVLTVVDVRADGRVRVGIDAPKSIPVHRREVYERTKKTALEAEGRP